MKARRRRISQNVKPASSSEPQAPRPYHIYELVFIIDNGNTSEPTESIFYVGMTNDPKGRYLQHANGDDNEDKTRRFRLAQEHPEDLSVVMRILDSTLDIEKARRLEAYWILYRSLEGIQLTNTNAGTCFAIWEVDEAHYDRLTRMLHDTYGCCKSNGCMYEKK